MSAGFHMSNCMCDECIKRRTREKAEERNRAEREAPYIARRGGEIGAISVAEALRRKRR